MYWVVGGEYKDTTWTTLLGPLERYGPFKTREEARKVWKEISLKNIDLAQVRYFVTLEEEWFEKKIS